MKNLILNLLSIISLAIFWTLFIATSQDENFGTLNMEASRTDFEITLKNNDSFDYDELEINFSYLDTLTNASNADSLVFNSFTKTIDLASNQSVTLPFKDFESRNRNNIVPDSISKLIILDVSQNCPDFDFCFFNTSLD